MHICDDALYYYLAAGRTSPNDLRLHIVSLPVLITCRLCIVVATYHYGISAQVGKYAAFGLELSEKCLFQIAHNYLVSMSLNA